MTDQTLLYRAYTIVERDKGQQPFWLNIGSAFVHKDGKGFNVILQALPLDGKLVLRIYEEQPPQQGSEKPVAKVKKKSEQALEQA